MKTPDTLTFSQYAQIMKEALAGALPSLTTPEALAKREAIEKELDEIHAKGYHVDVSSDTLDYATGPLIFPDQTQPLALPLEGLTARAIRRHLSIDERMWFNRMIGEYGEAEVLKRWPSFEVQLNFERSL
jgi:hypothetical protein